MAREVARRFDQLYCGVDPHTEDRIMSKRRICFPLSMFKLGRTRRLIGLGAPGPEGNLLKMSKSLNNPFY